jgi:autotransporter-associated beta strand protein
MRASPRAARGVLASAWQLACRHVCGVLAGVLLLGGATSAQVATQAVIVPPGSDTLVTCQVNGIGGNTIGNPDFLSVEGGIPIGTGILFDPVDVEYDGTDWVNLDTSTYVGNTQLWLRGGTARVRNPSSLPLTLTLTGIPRDLIWTGAVNGNWDIDATANWSDGGVATTFWGNETVTFDNAAAEPADVNLTTALAPTGVNVTGGVVTLGGPGKLTGNASLAVNGGLLTILTANDYSGNTTVHNGTLLVNGSLGQTTVTVNAGATIGGHGSVDGPLILAGGSLAPGDDDTGTLVAGSAVINGTFVCRIDGPTSDCLAVKGNLDLTNATLLVVNPGPPTAVNYVIATYTGSLTGVFNVAAGTLGHGLPPGYELDYSQPGKVVVRRPATAGVNELLSSGTIEQFANIPLYAEGGIVITVGAVGEHLFPESERVKAALVAATQAGDVVAPGWRVTTRFEEWTDRIIIRKTTGFEMLDGGRFNTEFLGGPDFVPSENIETDDQPPPTEAEVLAMATAYIASGEHLSLYPAAAAAGEVSPQALLDELGNDRGPVEITETIEFARIATPREDLETILPGPLPVLGQEPVAGAQLTLPQGSLDTGLNPPVHFGAPTEGGAMGRSSGTSGTASYSARMLNGFTIGNEWQNTFTYDRKWGIFRATVRASFGFGVRIPWQADVEVSPSRIHCPAAPDRTPFQAAIKLNTLDANADFYRALGLPENQIYDGQEFVARAGTTINVFFRVLGTTYVNGSIGRTVDLGRNFDPPLNSTLPLGTVTIPFENTGLGTQVWYAGYGVDLGVGFGITGNRFDISVSPQNSTNIPGYGTSPRALSINQENQWRTLDFAIRDTAPTKWQPVPFCRKFYRYGPLYHDASYYTTINVSPQARVRGTLYLSKISKLLSNVNISSGWWTITTVGVALPQLGPNTNTISRIDASTGTERMCKTACGQNTLPMDRAAEFLPSGNRAYRVFGRVSAGGVVTEYLPHEGSLVAGSITGGGVYNEATHSITWMIPSGSQVVDVSYSLAGGAEDSRPIGKWQPQGAERAFGVRNSPDTTQEEADSELLIWELAQRPTLQQIEDGRLGSVLIQKGPDGAVQLRLHLQTSEDLIQWTTTPETLLDPVIIDHPLGADKLYFRFKLAE